MTVYVDFEPIGRRGECPPGASLLDCARQLGVELVSLCAGGGSCGRCAVQILKGEFSEPTHLEGELLSPEQLAQGFRLACRTIPRGRCKVRVPPTSLTAPQRTQVEGEEVTVAPEPLVRTYRLRLAAPSLEDLRADADRLIDALGDEHGVRADKVDLAVLQSISPRLREEGWQVRAAVREGEVVALLPAEGPTLGLAVDLGTTKIAGYLLDLETGRTLASTGMMNPQIAYGEDVIARLAFAGESAEQAMHLQRLVADALGQLAGDLCAEPSQVVEAVVVGNTAMHHLFTGLPVWQLARAPYVPAVQQALDVKARELGLCLAPGAYVHLLPNVAGYVGADHVAALLASDVARAGGVVLVLDIGTNTEVCLVNRGRLRSTSCASGPAFEGAHIKCGMRAANGAIERVRLVDNKIEYQTIGASPAAGLCGSGIVDTLAQLYEAGVVDARGRMGDHIRVRGEGPQREFILVGDGEAGARDREVTFTQRDVRQLQLAKGAVHTGIELLLRADGLAIDDIDQVIVAGAFGTYIDVASAIAIGMLPPLPLDRFRQVGNAAGMGAKMALLSRRKRREAHDLARQVRYLELATDPEFARTFARSMYLGWSVR